MHCESYQITNEAAWALCMCGWGGGSTLLIFTNMHFCSKTNEFYSPQNMSIKKKVEMNINLNLDDIDRCNHFLIRQIFGQIKYVMSMYAADFANNKV